MPDKGSIDTLHNSFGKRYKEILVTPECRASAWKILAEITSDSLSFLDKSALESLIQKDISQVLKQRHVIVTRLEVNQILLPADLKTAIKLGLEDAYTELK